MSPWQRVGSREARIAGGKEEGTASSWRTAGDRQEAAGHPIAGEAPSPQASHPSGIGGSALTVTAVSAAAPEPSAACTGRPSAKSAMITAAHRR